MAPLGMEVGKVMCSGNGSWKSLLVEVHSTGTAMRAPWTHSISCSLVFKHTALKCDKKAEKYQQILR